MPNNIYNSNMKWFYKFIKRHGYSINPVTHAGQELKRDSKEHVNVFFNIIFNCRRQLNIIDNICQIGNMDETSIN